MILKNIKVNNFRQFYGEQEVNFATGNENITIIFGRNGEGKTGVFRALMFALYGDLNLEQDNPNHPVHLVNFLAINENPGMPVESSVEIEFQSGRKNYHLSRTVSGIRMNNEIREQITGVELFIIDEQGNYSAEPIIDEDRIAKIVNEILHNSIKSFFLFDGEKIETLAKTDKEVQKEVKLGIVKLLRIDKLEEAITMLNSLHRLERQRITKESKNLDLDKRQNEIDKFEEKIDSINELLSIKTTERDNCSNEINEINSKLAENEDVRRNQVKSEGIKHERNLHLQLLAEKRAKTKSNLVSNGANLLSKDSYQSVQDYLELVMIDQKDLIPYEVIEKSLIDMKCATCGSDLNDNNHYLDHVKFLKENYRRSNLTPLIQMISNQINEYKFNEEEIKDKITNDLKEYREVKDTISALNKDLEEIDDEISLKASKQINLKALEESLVAKKSDLEEIKVEIRHLKDNLITLESDKNVKEKEFKQVIHQDKSLRIDSQVLRYIEDMRTKFQEIFEAYSNTMRKKLSEETTAIFKKLIDNKDRDLIDRIDINDKYEINIISWGGISITQDISQGQRHIVSLSFITALAKVAAGEIDNIAFPLFMDSPFGRISGDNRDNLIENIPLLTSQWVPLLTDTEMSITEEIKFKSTGKLGKWYKLQQKEKFHTVITEIKLNESIATRG